MEVVITRLKELLLEYGPNLVMALLTLVIGWLIIGLAIKGVGRVMERKKVDPTLRPFLRGSINVGLKVLLLISVASMVGIETTSFIALLGAAGLAIGLALQGSLANLGGGVLLLILRPFKVGDYVTAGGHSGTVDAIQIFYTVLRTPQNQIITVSNGQLSNNSIINYTAERARRMDLVFGISYSDDIDQAREVLMKLVQDDPRIDEAPEPQVLLDGLADSSVNLRVRFWTNIDDFWPLNFEFQEKVKKAFDENNITIPFPQRELTYREAPSS